MQVHTPEICQPPGERAERSLPAPRPRCPPRPRSARGSRTRTPAPPGPQAQSAGGGNQHPARPPRDRGRGGRGSPRGAGRRTDHRRAERGWEPGAAQTRGSPAVPPHLQGPQRGAPHQLLRRPPRTPSRRDQRAQAHPEPRHCRPRGPALG